MPAYLQLLPNLPKIFLCGDLRCPETRCDIAEECNMSLIENTHSAWRHLV